MVAAGPSHPERIADRALYLARTIYQWRRQRDELAVGTELFGEPGWDILLDLFIAQREDVRLQVSSVCINTTIPPTTILRWLGRLEADGLAVRVADAGDARRRYMRMTAKGLALVESILAGMDWPWPGNAPASGEAGPGSAFFTRTAQG